ncbi:uncharacterized protein LOC119453821 isoform X1 [Dermacentor silvarum]|nr:uncharacterized protein LOC119453821 isoform X1 [Dermacentor silvarum]
MAGSTKLHDAVRHDRCRLIARLVAEGTPVDAVDSSGNSALFVAITDGPVSAVPYLLQAGADPNFRCSEGATPVHAACRRGSRALLQQLLECGGDLRLRDASGRTPQDWALGHADPQCRRKLVAFINTKRALAYRFGDAAALLDDDAAGGGTGVDGSPSKGGAAAAASLRRRLVGRPAVPRRPWCGERIRADGGFGVVYCSPARETGVTTFVPFIASNYLYNSEDNNITWSGPQSLMQTMYWDKLKVSVKKSSLNGSHSRGPGSDILITELEKIRRLSFHPYLLWPLAVSPVQNMDDMLLVFECVHFGSLFDVLHNAQHLLASGPLDQSRLLLLLQQTCEALLFLHSRHWVHGCVSSHCIYVVSPCLGKLGNFEFVQRSEDAEGGDAASYSPPGDDFLDFYCHWLAPEVLTGGRPTKAADLYEFCVVLWELFTEEVPWGSAERAAVERAVTQERRGLSHRSEIPPPLDTLLHTALALDPAERGIDLEDVYQALAAAVQEGQGNVGFAVGRLEQAGDTGRIKSTPGKPLPSRQASTVEVEHATFVHRPTVIRRRPPSIAADDVSDIVEELISLADEDRAAPLHRTPPRRPSRSQPPRGGFTATAASVQQDLLDSKFDQISLSSSLDPMDFATDPPKVPTFSSRPVDKPSYEACTQTDPETPPTLRPRTRGFVPGTRPTSVSDPRTSSHFSDNLLLDSEDVPAKASSAKVVHQPAAVTAQQQPQQQSVISGGSGSVRRTVRPCKPASHSYGVSPFVHGGTSRIMSSASTQQHRTAMDSSTTTYNTAHTELSNQQQQQQWRVRQGIVETRHRQQTSFATRGTNVCRMDDAILEGLGDGERYHKQVVGRSVCAETTSQPRKLEEEDRTLVADYSLPSGLAMMGDDVAESSEVKSVQTEPHHAYKVEVVTMTCPVIQHTLTVTSTNLLTGETTVTEESTGAEVVQVQWNPDQINITTPDTSLNSSTAAAGVPDVSPATAPPAPVHD